MKKENNYFITITETRQIKVKVFGQDEQKAIAVAEKAYADGEIDMSASQEIAHKCECNGLVNDAGDLWGFLAH